MGLGLNEAHMLAQGEAQTISKSQEEKAQLDVLSIVRWQVRGTGGGIGSSTVGQELFDKAEEAQTEAERTGPSHYPNSHQPWRSLQLLTTILQFLLFFPVILRRRIRDQDGFAFVPRKAVLCSTENSGTLTFKFLKSRLER